MQVKLNSIHPIINSDGWIVSIAKSLASLINWFSSNVIGAVGNIDYPSYRNKTGFTALSCPTPDGTGAFTSYVDTRHPRKAFFSPKQNKI